MARKVTPLELIAAPRKRGRRRSTPKTWKAVERTARTTANTSGSNVLSSAASRDADRNRIAARREARAAERANKVRLYYGLTKQKDNNALLKLAQGRSRLTTPQERKIKIADPRFPTRYPAFKKDGYRYPAVDRTFKGKDGTPLYLYGSTTPDERVQGERRRIKRVHELRDEKAKLSKSLEKTHNDAMRVAVRSGNFAVPAAAAAVGNPKKTKERLVAVSKALDELDPKGPNTVVQGFFGAMENLSRPYYGFMGGAKAAVDGQRPDRVLKHVGRGVALKERPEAWDVLEEAGVKNKYVKYGLGVPASFAADPMTYVSLALAPETAGASAAALTPKVARLERLAAKASKLSATAKASGKASDAAKAKKAMDKAWKVMEANALHATPVTPTSLQRRGIRLKVGARVPLTQKRVGFQTSGKTSAKVARSIPLGKGPRAQVARDRLVESFAPTGTPGALTHSQARVITDAAAGYHAAVPRATAAAKTFTVGSRKALAHEAGVGKIQRIFRPFRSKRLIDDASRKLHEARDAGEDTGRVSREIDEVNERLLTKERSEGIDTPEFMPASTTINAIYDDAAQIINKSAKKAGKKAQQHRHMRDGAGEGHADFDSLDSTYRRLRTTAQSRRAAVRELRETPFQKRTGDHLRQIAENGELSTKTQNKLHALAQSIDDAVADDAVKYTARHKAHEINPKDAKAARMVAELDPVQHMQPRKNPALGFAKGRKIRRKIGDLDKPSAAETRALKNAERTVRQKEQAYADVLAKEEGRAESLMMLANRGGTEGERAAAKARMAEADERVNAARVARDEARKNYSVLQQQVRAAIDERLQYTLPGDHDALHVGAIENTAERMRQSGVDIARHKVNMAIIRTGHPVPKDFSDRLPHGHSVYEYDSRYPGRGLRRVEDVDQRNGKAQHFVINDHVVRRAEDLMSDAHGKGVPFGRALDKMTGKWKGSVTVWWPGYYARNLVGDTMLARQAGTGTRDLMASLKVALARHHAEKVKRSGKHISKGKDPNKRLDKWTVKVGGRKYTAREIEELAEEHGAIGSGLHGSEIAQRVGARNSSVTNPANRANVARENLPRRGTFIAALRRGEDAAGAARTARREHYDYGLRTPTEKQIRRIVPFYSWLDLNTRKQFRLLASNPSKPLHIYRVLQAASDAAGFESYQEFISTLQDGQQKSLPIPIKIGGKVRVVQFGNVLSELNILSGPKAIGAKGIAAVGPLKLPGELAANHSFFYGGEIERQGGGNARWEPAPSKLIPRSQWSKFGIEERVDRKTGRKVPMWRRKHGYAIRSLGPWGNAIATAASDKGERGPYDKTRAETLSGFTGLSVSTLHPEKKELSDDYERYNDLKTKIDLQDNNTEKGQKAAKIYRERQKVVAERIYAKEKAMGYKIPFKAGAPSKSETLGPFDFKTKFDTNGKSKFDFKTKFDEKADEKKPVATVASRARKLPNMNRSQKEIVAAIVSIGKKRGVPEKHILAALETGRVESNFANSATMTDHDSQGWRQERASIYKNPTNLKASINRFYNETEQMDRKGLSAGDLAANVQRPAAQYRGRYAQHESEARNILAKLSGAKPSPVGGDAIRGPYKSAYTVPVSGGKKALTPLARQTMRTIATHVPFAPEITSGRRPGSITTSGNVSDHDSGNGLDIGVGGDIRGGGGSEKKGNELAYAAFRTAGLSKKEARANAKKGGVYNINRNGVRYQILWKTEAGGNHFNHVHVGVKGGAGADSSSYSGGSGGGGYSPPTTSHAAAPSGSAGAATSRTPKATPALDLLDTDEGRMAVYEYLTSKKKDRSETLARTLKKLKSEMTVV